MWRMNKKMKGPEEASESNSNYIENETMENVAMKTKRLERAASGIITAAAIAFVVGPLAAWANEETRASTTPTVTASTIERSSSLMGMPIRNEAGQSLGKVRDVILSEDGKAAEYLVFFSAGTSRSEFPTYVPYNEVKWSADRKALVSDITPEKSKVMSKKMEYAPAWSRHASRLIGLPARDVQGRSLGSIRDLLIDKKTGEVIAATVGTRGFLGLGSKFASVEWSALRIEPTTHVVSLSLTRDEFKQLAYSERKYWEQLGFSSPEEQRSNEDPEMRDVAW